MTTVETVEVAAVSDIDRVAGEWLELAAGLETTSYFQTPDWVASWWATVADGPPTTLGLWRSESRRLQAVVALSRATEPLHRGLPARVPVVVNAGSGAGDADHCDWIVSPDFRSNVRSWVSEAIGGATLLVRNVGPDTGESQLPNGARVVDRFVCPTISVPAEETRIGRSSNFRHQLRTFTRRLAREGVTFRWTGGGRLDDSILMSLFSLHGELRSQRALNTSFGPSQFAFHKELVRRGTPSRGPAALVAECNDRVIGVLYGFWWRDTFSAYQSGWDPAWARFSLGTILVYQAIRAAGNHGARSFDFLRGAEPYKYRFGASDELEATWIVPRGPAGRVLGAKYRAKELRARARGLGRMAKSRRTDAQARRGGNAS